MKIIKNLVFLSFFLYVFKCTSNKPRYSKILKVENLNILNDEFETIEEQRTNYGILSFSFDKDNFTNFECEINDLYLSSEEPKKLHIYHNNSASNLIYIFCLFFQYSELRNNKDFRRIVEDQFVCHQSKTDYLKNYLNPSYVNNSKTFDEHLSELDFFVKNVLEGKCSDIVSVEEKNGRILITPSRFASRHLKSLEEFSLNFHHCYLDIEIETLIMEIYWRYNQINSLISCACNLRVNQCKPCKDLSGTIQALISKIDCLIDVKKGLSTMDFERKFIYGNNLKYFSIFARKSSNNDLFGHVSELIYRLKVKSLNENMKVYLTVFSKFPEECMESLINLSNMIMHSLQNNSKINFNTTLSSSSINALVTNCLLLDS